MKRFIQTLGLLALIASGLFSNSNAYATCYAAKGACQATCGQNGTKTCTETTTQNQAGLYKCDCKRKEPIYLEDGVTEDGHPYQLILYDSLDSF